MAFKYKRVLLVGATSGIGAAMADKLILEGAKVIAVGRRQEKLDEFVQKHGAANAAGVRYDVTDRVGLDGFVDGIVKNYPDLDCVFLNSGVQSQVRLSRPSEVDLNAFHEEISTNFSRLVDLSIKFLPHLLSKPFPTALIVTGTLLALIPSVTMPAYCASKAALHAYMCCLRRQHQGSSTKIIEIWPPVVQTELHDYMGERGRAFGMPAAVFIEQAWAQLEAGSDHVIVGAAGPEESFKEIVKLRKENFDALSDLLLAHFQL
ncbi:hypothetical protein DL95DRAFT_356832 [Leptodontidium sp. 2 PMI_412]|nr:hypothetical protein BKA61DRAFT_538905 [Leptodontidium sp. MPI-SDFR-AT-0119]KAH9220873.1 hypothetical protein DL95DRAFT_356832 [Leptodontidium sp. 2 PMI_412]